MINSTTCFNYFEAGCFISTILNKSNRIAISMDFLKYIVLFYHNRDYHV